MIKRKIKKSDNEQRKTFSSFFGIGKSQSELDFVDIDLDHDNPLFIDPFAMKQRTEVWACESTETLTCFFQTLVDHIKAERLEDAKYLLSFLKEPNEIRFGLSENHPKGAGIGPGQAKQILNALMDSSAVKTGFINAIEDCELMVDGIGRDKISDLAANVIRKHLIRYTQNQCSLYDIPMSQVGLPQVFDPETLDWTSDYGQLPVYDTGPIILIPKIIARYHPSFNHWNYYNDFVLDYIITTELDARASLVKTLKAKRITKKAAKEKFPCSKQSLYEFSKNHPEVLERYKAEMKRRNKNSPAIQLENEIDERLLAKILRKDLEKIEAGSENANAYHNLMLSIVEFIFFPNLTNPIKEDKIHQGRKRIDITMDNGAEREIFYLLRTTPATPCPFIFLECKNYVDDPKNPELDQLAGRFSPQRGKVGILLCRIFNDFDRFLERCRDTYKDDRGLVLGLDDKRVVELLELIGNGKRADVNGRFVKWFREVGLS